MASTVQCPNCNQPVALDSEYCIFCGTKLPAAPHPSAFEGYEKAIKKCSNGHEFDDASLLYCPICGLPFEGGPAPYVPTGEAWKCTCGHVNPADNVFCELCSHPKEPKASRRAGSAETGSAPVFIPEGMREPNPDDLMPKKRSNKV